MGKPALVRRAYYPSVGRVPTVCMRPRSSTLCKVLSCLALPWTTMAIDIKEGDIRTQIRVEIAREKED